MSMWQGVRTFVDNVAEDHIVNELFRINPNIERCQRRKLRDMARRASHLAVRGYGQQALIQLRSCLMLSMRGMEDPESLSSVQALISLLPYSKFEEPVASVECGLSQSSDIEEALRNTFGVNSPQYLNLSSERQKALVQALKFRMSNPPFTCAITWEDLGDSSGKLTVWEQSTRESIYYYTQPDVVALFEEDRKQIEERLTTTTTTDRENSVVLVLDEEVPFVEDENLKTEDEKKYRFATTVLDTALNSSRNTVKTAVKRIKEINYSKEQQQRQDIAMTRSLEDHRRRQIDTNEQTEETTTLNHQPEVHTRNGSQYLSKKSRISIDYNKKEGGRRLTIRPATPIKQHEYKKEKVLIRCHFFKGTALKEWFDMGHVSNPVTRCTVMVEDWCRLTEVREKPISSSSTSHRAQKKPTS